MIRPNLESQASPAVLSADLRRLIRETYLEVDKRLAIMTMIDRHVEHLNALGKYNVARQFLLDQEFEIGEDAKRLEKEQKRARVRLVVRTASPFFVIVAAKYIAAYLGL